MCKITLTFKVTHADFCSTSTEQVDCRPDMIQYTNNSILIQGATTPVCVRTPAPRLHSAHLATILSSPRAFKTGCSVGRSSLGFCHVTSQFWSLVVGEVCSFLTVFKQFQKHHKATCLFSLPRLTYHQLPTRPTKPKGNPVSRVFLLTLRHCFLYLSTFSFILVWNWLNKHFKSLPVWSSQSFWLNRPREQISLRHK